MEITLTTGRQGFWQRSPIKGFLDDSIIFTNSIHSSRRRANKAIYESELNFLSREGVG